MEDEKPGGAAAQSQGSSTESIQTPDLAPTEWTNKKHSCYLSSMEASFIKQLHRVEHDSEDLLGWVSHKSASRSTIYNHKICCQFKVLCGGQWERTNFGMRIARIDAENQTHHSLFENPWIKHFAPHIDDKLQQKSPTWVGTNQITSEEMHLASSITQQKQAYHLQAYGRYPSRRRTEVSDQNFVEKTSQVEKLNKKTMRKRVRKAKFGLSIVKDEQFHLGNLPRRYMDEDLLFLENILLNGHVLALKTSDHVSCRSTAKSLKLMLRKDFANANS